MKKDESIKEDPLMPKMDGMRKKWQTVRTPGMLNMKKDESSNEDPLIPKMNPTQQKWHKEMKEKHRCFKKFINSLNSLVSQQSYGYQIQKFMKFCVKEKYVTHVENFEELLVFDSDKITDVLEDYVVYLQEEGTKAVPTLLTPVELFFTMNRKIWHNKLVRKGIKNLDTPIAGKLPITDEEIELVYNGCTKPRDRALISFLGCLGIRPGAIADPVMRFKHLIPIDDCYGIKVYDESKEGYWGIIIPEARKDIDAYKQSRIRNGEIVTDESPIFVTNPKIRNTKFSHLRSITIQHLIPHLIKGKVVRKIVHGDRYDKAIVYMFRKRFSQKLGLENNVNSNIAELCMGHKLPGSQHTYQSSVTLEQVYKAVKPAFESLTIDSNARKDIALEKVTKELEKVTGEMEERLFNRLHKGVTRPEL